MKTRYYNEFRRRAKLKITYWEWLECGAPDLVRNKKKDKGREESNGKGKGKTSVE